MAQTGNSCSNPYVMNLAAGAISNQINIASSDSIFYISLTGFSNKVGLSINLDTIGTNGFISKWQVNSNNCNNPIIIADRIYYARFNEINGVLDLSGYDTVTIVIHKASLIGPSNYNNEMICQINLNTIYGGTPDPCTTQECNNLLQNASFEGFTPPTMNFSQIPQLGVFLDSFVCHWSEIEPGPAYFNNWFSDPAGCLAQASPPSVCNSFSLSFNGGSNNYPLQNNPYFQNNSSYIGLNFGDNGASQAITGWSYGSGIIRGQLTSPLVQNRKYFVESNIAKPPRQFFGGQLDFELSTNPNFVQSNYPAGTVTTLSTPAIDFDPALGWTKLNTIFESPNGGEQFLYIGNLTLAPVLHNPCTPNCMCGNQMGHASFNILDNFIVKEFFADAGDPDITICTGSEIGGSSCPFPLPNATYEWLPANLFDDNTLYHPTFIGTTNATVSLTVSILMSDGTTQISDPSYVNITVIQGNSITIAGQTTVLSGGNTTLNLSNGTNFSWTGSDGTSGFSSSNTSIFTGSLTQDVTYTINATSSSGCSVTEVVTVTVTQLPAACISDSIYPNTIIIPDGTDYNAFLNTLGLTQGLTNYNIINTNFALAGTFTIDLNTPISFFNCHFYCYDASSIINNANLTMQICTLEACNNMWKGITNNKNLYLNGCYIADAENGVHLANGSNYNINTNVFENNLFGILMGGIGGGQITGVDYSNIYRNPNLLKPAYANMQGYKNRSEAGIKVFNISYTQIGLVSAALPNNAAITVCNRFEDINCGISIFNSDVKIVNSKFNNINPFNASTPGTLLGLQHNGAAIYASSFSNRNLSVEPIPGYTGFDFENCNYGIKTFRNSVRANGLSMKTLKYGFDIQNAINCTYQLNENEIKDYSIAGISILGAHNASSINLSYNQINSNLNANKGIRVSGALSGGITGNCYIGNNTLQVGAGASGGIDVSGMRSPVIQSNHVKKDMYYLAWGSTYGFKGYNFSACNDALVNCNYATRSINGGTNIGSDYQFNLSNNSFIKCNNSGASPYGFDFRGPQAGTIFRTNTMGNHSTGLYIASSGVIGPQPANPSDPYEGNKWTGSYSSGFGARNLSIDPTDPNSIIDHQFLTKPQDGITYNPTVNPSIWFAPTTTNPIAPCNILNCPQFRSPLIGNMGFYQAIANRTIITSDYPVESLWMLQGTLYEYLTQDPSLLLQNDSLALFYYNPMIEGIKDLKNIEDTLKKGAIDLMPFYAALHGNDSLMQDKANEIDLLNEAIEADTLNDSLLIYHRTIKMAQYLFLQQSNEAIYQSINEAQEQVAATAYTQNQEVEPGNVNEAIEKDINELYLRTLALGRTNFSPSDIQLLHNIAHLCPLAAGPAVYRARDMYALINDTLQYSDSTVCAFEGYFRESANTLYPALIKKEKHLNYFKAQPNPASSSVLFTFKANDSTSDLTIYNLSGNIIYNTVLNANTNQLTIDISNFAKGVYIAHVVNTKTSSRIKFIVN